MTGETLRDKDLEADRRELCQEMAISSWEINMATIPKALIGPKDKKAWEQPGFRYFRVIQTGKNSSGAHNLSLSYFEIYGIKIGSWGMKKS
jgi:hypothetical protein